MSIGKLAGIRLLWPAMFAAGPGNYLVEMCATPGTLALLDMGVQSCAKTGMQECVTVPFTMPGPPVTASLPP